MLRWSSSLPSQLRSVLEWKLSAASVALLLWLLLLCVPVPRLPAAGALVAGLQQSWGSQLLPLLGHCVWSRNIVWPKGQRRLSVLALAKEASFSWWWWKHCEFGVAGTQEGSLLGRVSSAALSQGARSWKLSSLMRVNTSELAVVLITLHRGAYYE